MAQVQAQMLRVATQNARLRDRAQGSEARASRAAMEGHAAAVVNWGEGKSAAHRAG